MMFSDEDLRRALADGSLVVEPFHPGSVKGAALTLHLGEKLLRPLPGVTIDVKNNVLPEYEEIHLTSNAPYLLPPGGFVLGATYETITVGAKLGFLIEGRSTLARLGLTVVQTAMIVNPGHRNRAVTLELANHGPNAMYLYPKMRIARAAIIELKSAAVASYDDRGKYREQTGVGRPIFDREFMPE